MTSEQNFVRSGSADQDSWADTGTGKAGFHAYMDRMSARAVQIIGAGLAIVALVLWPTDFLLFDESPLLFETLFVFRATLIVTALVAIVLMKSSRVARSRPNVVFLVAACLNTAVDGYVVGRAGGLDSPLFYGGYVLPFLTVLMVMPLVKRCAATALIIVTYFVSCFAPFPGLLDHPLAGVPFVFLCGASGASIAAGHVVYRLLRANYFQRELLRERAHELSTAVTELQTTRGELFQSEKMRSLGTLLAGVAHELNNPLCVVIGFAHLLRREPSLTGRAYDYAQRIHAAAEQASVIVKKLSAFSRTSGDHRVVELDTIVDRALELVEYELQARHVEVTVAHGHGLPPVFVEEQTLVQALVNLLTNARHAVTEQPTPGAIEVTTRCISGDRVQLVVRDNGPGVPAELRARIFEPFFTTKSVGQGTGLGLSIVHRIVEDHGGTVRCEPADPPPGAQFVIELPQAAERASEPSDLLPRREPTETHTTRSLSGARVLVVDDETDLCSLLTDALQLCGAVVESASDGERALEKLREHQYDLVVCDLWMPVRTGIQLYEELERTQPDVLPHFFFVTGDASSSRAAEFLHRTDAPCAEKPFQPGVLLQRFGEMLANDDGRRRARRPNAPRRTNKTRARERRDS